MGRWTPLAIWFSGIVMLMASLAVGHLFSLAGPDRHSSRLTAGLAELLADAPGRWVSIHVLFTECRCSQRIFEHLRTSQRPADLDEVVLLVGDDPGQAISAWLRPRGFEVVSTAADTLAARFGIEGAPTLVVVDPARSVRYIGGYTVRQQGPDIRDLAIVREVRHGDQVADLPIFGCAVSQRLRAVLDPFSIRR